MHTYNKSRLFSYSEHIQITEEFSRWQSELEKITLDDHLFDLIYQLRKSLDKKVIQHLMFQIDAGKKRYTFTSQCLF